MQNYFKGLGQGLAVWTYTTKSDSRSMADNVEDTNVNESLSIKRKRDEGASSKDTTIFPSILSMVTLPLNALLSLSPNFRSNSSTNDKLDTNINDDITNSDRKKKESSDNSLSSDDDSNDMKPPSNDITDNNDNDNSTDDNDNEKKKKRRKSNDHDKDSNKIGYESNDQDDYKKPKRRTRKVN